MRATSWPAKRWAALVLTLLLIGLGINAWRANASLKHLAIFAMGVILGTAYTALGRLPDWVIAASKGSITHDDDPANISPKVYLAIIGAAILMALAALWLVLH